MRDRVDDGLQFLVFLGQLRGDTLQLLFIGFPLGDIGADGDVLARLSRFVEEGKDRGIDPIERAILGAVLDFAVPDLAVGNRGPELTKEPLRMMPGIDDPVVLAQQFFAGVFRNGAELVVYVGEFSRGVGDGDNGVLI